MPSYLVTGASRGLGFALLQQISENPDNIVITIVRNKSDTDSKIAVEIIPTRKNIFVIQGDLTNLDSLKNAFIETKKIIGDCLDVLIANGGLISDYSAFRPLTELGQDDKALEDDLIALFQTNVVGNIRLFNIFLPLIRKGQTKKVATISSAMTDEKVTVEIELFESAPYSISKAAINMAIAKFQAEFKNEGIIFMGVCPGNVNTGHHSNLSPEDMERLMVMGGKFAAYAPHLKEMASNPADAARDVLNVIRNATLEANGGQLVSHFGNKQWL